MEPNEDTLAAIKEAESGALNDAKALDVSSVEAFEASIGINQEERDD